MTNFHSPRNIINKRREREKQRERELRIQRIRTIRKVFPYPTCVGSTTCAVRFRPQTVANLLGSQYKHTYFASLTYHTLLLCFHQISILSGIHMTHSYLYLSHSNTHFTSLVYSVKVSISPVFMVFSCCALFGFFFYCSSLYFASLFVLLLSYLVPRILDMSSLFWVT